MKGGTQLFHRHLTGRQRTRTPRPNNRVPGPGTWVFVHDGDAEYEGVDYDGEWWDAQNKRSQQRRDEEFQMNLDAMD